MHAINPRHASSWCIAGADEAASFPSHYIFFHDQLAGLHSHCFSPSGISLSSKTSIACHDCLTESSGMEAPEKCMSDALKKRFGKTEYSIKTNT